MDLLNSVQMRFDAICESILGHLTLVQTTEQELSLRRLFDSIEWFLDAVDGSSDDTEPLFDTGTCALQRKVTEQMIQFYERSDDFLEARRFRLRLARQRKERHVDDQDDGSQHEAMSFVKVSEQISNEFRTLGFPNRCKGVSKGAHKGVIPAAHLAVYSGRFQTATMLTQSGRNSDDEMDILDRCLSHLAVECGNKELLQTALTKSDTSKDRDVYAMTPLALAARIGDLDMFKALHKGNYCLDARDLEGRSVLCIAAGAGQKEIVSPFNIRQSNANDAAGRVHTWVWHFASTEL